MPDDPQGSPADEPIDPRRFGEMVRRFLQEGTDQPELAAAFKAMGIDPADPRTMAAMEAQLRTIFAPGAGAPDTAAMAGDIARKVVAADPKINDTVGSGQDSAVADAVGIARMWLEPGTTFDIATGPARAYSRAQWVEATMPTWLRITEPVAVGVATAIENATASQLGRLGDLDVASDPAVAQLLGGMDPAGFARQMGPMMRRMGRQMFALQTGQAVGALAADLVTATETGLPLVPAGTIGLLPTAVDEFADGLEIDRTECRIYCAVREAARATLFTAVPWLGPQLLTAVEDYARHITIDTDAIEQTVRSIDPSDPSALQAALGDQLFHPQPTAEQSAALQRLETYLALAEGWVDQVTSGAVAERLPHAAALAESARRRRIGGVASKTFAGLVGLRLEPKRQREALSLWQILQDAGGEALRDSGWAHPDVAPTAADLDDPFGYLDRLRGGGPTSNATDDLDAVLADILREADAGPGSDPGEAGDSGATDDPGRPS